MRVPGSLRDTMFLSMISFLIVGCSHVGFAQSSSSSLSCAEALNQETVPVKLLFVLDTSGSNSGTNGTDVGKVVREQSIETFYKDNMSKTNIFYGLITFANNQAPALIYQTNNGDPTFSNSSAVIQSAFTNFASVVDAGNTPYDVALGKAVQAIGQDTGANASTKYIVVFMSDGLPNPAPAGGNAQLDSEVQAILATKPGQVTFNTIYYGPTDADASSRLAEMAQVGEGQTLDTNANPTGRDFAITDVLTVPGSGCAH